MSFKLLLFFLSFILSVNNISAQEKIIKTDSEWKAILTPKQYHILREKATEYAFSGKYDKFYKKGTYYCVACNTSLFTSESKFNSGTGWPSFDNHIDDHIDFHIDTKYGMIRTEITCKTCDGHLGHLFMDASERETGKRYCVNSLALIFKE